MINCVFKKPIHMLGVWQEESEVKQNTTNGARQSYCAKYEKMCSTTCIFRIHKLGADTYFDFCDVYK